MVWNFFENTENKAILSCFRRWIYKSGGRGGRGATHRVAPTGAYCLLFRCCLKGFLRKEILLHLPVKGLGVYRSLPSRLVYLAFVLFQEFLNVCLFTAIQKLHPVSAASSAE